MEWGDAVKYHQDNPDPEWGSEVHFRYLMASRSPPGQDCRRQAMKEQMDEKMKYSRRALWKRTATNMPEESEHSYSKRNQG